MAAIEEAEREAMRVAARHEAQREAERAAAAEAALQAACVAAVDEARREAERLVAEVAALEAARVAATAEAERQVARIAAAEEARREAVRVGAEEVALEASRLAALKEAEREAARMAALEEAEREAARVAALEESERVAARVAASVQTALEAERASAFEQTPLEQLPLAATDAPLSTASTPTSFEPWPIAVSVQVIHETESVAASLDAAAEQPTADSPLEAPAASVEIPHDAPLMAASITTSDETRAAAAPYDAELDSWIDAHQQPSMAASVEPISHAPVSVSEEATISADSVHEAAASSHARPVPVQPGVVVNISRNPIRSEAPPPAVEDPMLSGLERLLRVSSARGASTLYLSSGSRPSVRVDGELQMLDGEPVHAARDVESLLLTLMPPRSHEALRTGAATEWISQLEGVGRVRCMSFRDQRGPGGVFRLMPTRSVSADEVGLPKQMQALAIEPEGLVLIAGTRSSGKRTTMAAFVDLMNRTRRDHIITIEREINIQHDRGNSFISQREVRGNDEDMLAAMRAALREDPDVLVVEELRTSALMNVALEAAAAGRLVVGGFTAHTATGAIDRIIDLYAPEDHQQVQMALAHAMRGVIAQVLLRKVGGGRLPAREVLLNTPAVSSAIAEGKTSQLPMAIEGGRGYGMMPLNDALVGLVRNGAVEVRDAYRHSPDRPGFLAALNRQGIDTSFVEHLANG
jgi:twitching motility protein PilT